MIGSKRAENQHLRVRPLPPFFTTKRLIPPNPRPMNLDPQGLEMHTCTAFHVAEMWSFVPQIVTNGGKTVPEHPQYDPWGGDQRQFYDKYPQCKPKLGFTILDPPVHAGSSVAWNTNPAFQAGKHHHLWRRFRQMGHQAVDGRQMSAVNSPGWALRALQSASRFCWPSTVPPA